MIAEPPVSAIAHAIQLAVAPVFLLTGIGSLLGVMTTRLSRAVDRARKVEDMVAADPLLAPEHCVEIGVLRRRARYIGLAIGLCTFSELLIAAVVAILFLGAVLPFDAALWVALLFVAAMVALIAALLLFLRDVFLATAHLRIGKR